MKLDSKLTIKGEKFCLFIAGAAKIVPYKLFSVPAVGVASCGPDPHQRVWIQKSNLGKEFLEMVQDKLFSNPTVGVAGHGPDLQQCARIWSFHLEILKLIEGILYAGGAWVQRSLMKEEISNA